MKNRGFFSQHMGCMVGVTTTMEPISCKIHLF